MQKSPVLQAIILQAKFKVRVKSPIFHIYKRHKSSKKGKNDIKSTISKASKGD